jgi:alpha-D-ribose 1-methylphosphonate 5-triphosphate synthase subunit PhnH
MTDMALRSMPVSGPDDPARQSQRVFRVVMNAMARPGRVEPVFPAPGVPWPLSASAGAILLALADFETPIHLDTHLSASAPLRDWLGFHAGAPLTDDPARAGFAVIAADTPWPDFDDLARGTPDYPDRSTTLVCDGVSFGTGARFVLSGPGIRGTTVLEVAGLPDDVHHLLAQNRQTFPRGIDVLLVGQGTVAALPRSVQVGRA